MIAEAAHFSLIVAFLLSVIQGVLPLIGAARVDGGRDDFGWTALAGSAALSQLACLCLSFAGLVWLFWTSDFTVAVVAAHGNAYMPDLYRVAAAWGHHEGSMLLWVLILALYGGGLVLFGGGVPPGLRARTLAVQGLLGAGFLAFIVFTSNPFARLDPAPFNGADLNPILQHPALAFHPPFLYFGYVGLSIAYAFAVAALIEGRVDAAWARWVRPWTLAAWCALTVGIAMGSWWAYYELGWGGFWFWDPVENVSFAPWLLATALLHSCAVTGKRGALRSWTLLLAILAFGLSIVGAFVVRSGILTSVHAFASDPGRGVFILAFLVVTGGGALALYAWRAPGLPLGSLFAPVSREGALLLNNLFLATAAGAVLLGTLYPLLLESAGGGRISVGPPYFNTVLAPLLFALAGAMAVGPFLSWRRGDLAAAARRLGLAYGAVLLSLIAFWGLMGGPVLAVAVAALGVWLIAASVGEWMDRVRLGHIPWRASWHRARGVPRAAYGMTLAHAGFGVVILGIAGAGLWSQESVQYQSPGDSVTLAGYEVTLRGVRQESGPNYEAIVAMMAVHRDGTFVTMLEPEQRLYTASGQPTTESDVLSTPAGDLYISLGDPSPVDEGSWTTRIRYNPLVGWLWVGAALMGMGGLVSLSARRSGAVARVGGAAQTV